MQFLHRTWAEIDLTALRKNLEVIRNKARSCKIMAVVKANAYGHGVGNIAPVLEESGVDYFAVSNLDEALQLREMGIKAPVLILGYTPVEAVRYLEKNSIEQCVYCEDYAKKLSDEAVKHNCKIKIHIKLDTGMSRLGFDCRDGELKGISSAVECAELKGFELEGIFTHFAVADRTPDCEDGFTAEQYHRFIKGVKYFEQKGLKPQIAHCCNSAGTLLEEAKHCDLVRPGIILYGLTPNPDLELEEGLTPVMTLKSVVSMVKTINKGDTVNYGRTYKAEKPTKIATVAAGYADGYPRALSGKAYVMIKGKRAPVIGRICMDQLSVDVSQIENVEIGDEVILFGKALPIEELSGIAGTINYEIVCNISPRVPRITKGS